MQFKRGRTYPAVWQVKRACTGIQSEWSESTRRKRRETAEAKQRQLLSFLSSVATPQRVA
jgi:hypothetical protein